MYGDSGHEDGNDGDGQVNFKIKGRDRDRERDKPPRRPRPTRESRTPSGPRYSGRNDFGDSAPAEPPTTDFPPEVAEGEAQMQDYSPIAPITVNGEPLDRSRTYGSTATRSDDRRGQRNGDNPFFAALNFARDIEDSRHEATIVELRALMDALPDFKSRQNVLWRLVKATVENEELPRVLDEQAVLLAKRKALTGEETLSPADAERLDKVSGRANAITAPVFAVAWVTKMGYVAHLAKALGWALAHTQATTAEKFKAGVLDTRGQPGHEVRVYIVKVEALTTFAAVLRKRGDARAAEILELALRRNQESVKAGQERRELAELARLRAAREAAEVEAEMDPEPEAAPIDGESDGTEMDPEPEAAPIDSGYGGEIEANPA